MHVVGLAVTQAVLDLPSLWQQSAGDGPQTHTASDK